MELKFYTRDKFREKFNLNDSDDLFNEFFNWQNNEWEFARKNYDTLKELKVREFNFPDASVVVQFNPHRVGSTLALIDEKSIANRKCFLCDDNLHPEQKGIKLTENYTLLVNPFPIIPVHFTAKFNEHHPQKISDNFIEILEGAETLGEKYFLLYNGPEAGASVPEHRHFQGGTRKHFPLVNFIDEILSGYKSGSGLPHIKEEKNISNAVLYSVRDTLRRILVIKGRDKKAIEKLFFMVYGAMTNLFPSAKETKLNLVSTMMNGEHLLFIFPRKAHRPRCFYTEGDEQLLVSPATLDFGGVVVLPREEDFKKITKYNIEQIFSDVAFSEDMFSALLTKL